MIKKIKDKISIFLEVITYIWKSKEPNALATKQLFIGSILGCLGIAIIWYNTNFWVTLGIFLFVWGNNANFVKFKRRTFNGKD